MLPRVIEIDDLNCAREVQVGAVAQNDFLYRVASAALTGLQIDSFAKLFGGLDHSGVSGGIRIADGEALFVALGWVNTHPSLTSHVWAG